MKNSVFFVLTLFFIVITCSTAEAEKVADLFHEKLDSGDVEFICDNLLDDEALEASSRDEWLRIFETVASWGEIKNPYFYCEHA